MRSVPGAESLPSSWAAILCGVTSMRMVLGSSNKAYFPAFPEVDMHQMFLCTVMVRGLWIDYNIMLGQQSMISVELSHIEVATSHKIGAQPCFTGLYRLDPSSKDVGTRSC